MTTGSALGAGPRSGRRRGPTGRRGARARSRRAAVVLGALVVAVGCRRPAAPTGSVVRVDRGPLEWWVTFPARLEPERVHPILAPVSGQGTLIELVPDGTRVRAGDVVARFDASRIERELVRLQSALRTAEADFELLEKAEWPARLADLQRQLEEAREAADRERLVLQELRDLASEDLVSERAIQQQVMRLQQAEARVRQAERQYRLAVDYQQPLALAQARSRVEAARREWELAVREWEACTVQAPADGVVVHLPLHIGGDYRPARIGDTLFRNQPFLMIPEPEPLLALAMVPETDIRHVSTGSAARVIVAAFPERPLPARIVSVGGAAQMVSGRPAWQRFFAVVARLDETDERLRPGLSATLEVLALREVEVLRIPRAAVRWEGGRATVRVRGTRGTVVERELRTGRSDDRYIEVLDGVTDGELVEVP